MKMYVGNLSFNTSEQQLEDLFAEFGEVQSAALVTDRDTGRPRGFGFVEMSDSDAGQEAIEKLNGTNFGGRDLTVNEARPKTHSGGGGGGYRGGGGGGRSGGGGGGGGQRRGGW